MLSVRHLVRIVLPACILAVALLCALLLEANDRYRHALQAAPDSSPDPALKPMKTESYPDAPFREAGLARLRRELALAEQELEELTVAYQSVRQQASPDFQRLKAEALAELKRRREEAEIRSPAYSTSTSVEPMGDPLRMADSSAQNSLRRYGPALDVVGVNESTRQRIYEAFRERTLANAELRGQLARGEITPEEAGSLFSQGSDVDLIMEFLSEEQRQEFNRAEKERQDVAQRALYSRLIASQAGRLSPRANELLVEGVVMMNETQSSGAFLSFEQRTEARLEELAALRDWMATEVDEDDMEGVDLYIEFQTIEAQQRLEQRRGRSTTVRIIGGDGP